LQGRWGSNGALAGLIDKLKPNKFEKYGVTAVNLYKEVGKRLLID